MNKILISVLGILVILGALGFYFYSLKPETNILNTIPSPPSSLTSEITDNTEGSPSGMDNLAAGGNSYLDSTGLFNLLYPSDFKLDESDPKHPRIYKQGPTQKGQTEMYDGVIMVFEAVELGDKNLSQWTDDYIKTATADGTSQVTEAKKAYSIKNYPGFTFKMRSLGESQYYVLQKDSTSKNALIITTMVADPTNKGFQTEVNNTLSTLQILK